MNEQRSTDRPIGPLPTTAAHLRQLAMIKRGEAEDAERMYQHALDRASDAEDDAERAEQGIAPPGFYLADQEAP